MSNTGVKDNNPKSIRVENSLLAAANLKKKIRPMFITGAVSTV